MNSNKNRLRVITFLLIVFLVLSACRLTRTGNPISEIPFIGEDEPVQAVPTLSSGQSVTILVPEYTALEGSLEALYQNVSPGVVSLQYMDRQGGGQGTGFVIDKDGHIVTNYHVASDAQRLEVHFPSIESLW